jgi:hypothetical protein
MSRPLFWIRHATAGKQGWIVSRVTRAAEGGNWSSRVQCAPDVHTMPARSPSHAYSTKQWREFGLVQFSHDTETPMQGCRRCCCQQSSA